MQDVLIIDDAEINLILFSALIKKLEACQGHTFTSPLDGLAWATSHTPDLVIVDYMMPDMDGLAFIQRFRALPHCVDVPILMITANDQKQVRYRALDSGANDFLAKPVDKVEFLARARNMLSLSSARRKLADHAEWLASEVRKATATILQRERDTVFRLCKAAEYRDPETGAHIMRMAHYSQLIAKNLGLPVDQQELLLEAAPMHDLGKVGITDNILLKAGRLDEAEFEIMKRHATFGYELLKDSTTRVLQAGAEIALGHHEKFDGSGYPQGLKGEDIPLFSRIVAVADVFDALTSERPYKKAWTLEEAVDFLNAGSGSHFDPQCVQAFLEGFDEVLEIRGRYREDV
nr:HD domain-containing phosphohydrolase [uncultured Rhodoferax sp.]